MYNWIVTNDYLPSLYRDNFSSRGGGGGDSGGDWGRRSEPVRSSAERMLSGKLYALAALQCTVQRPVPFQCFVDGPPFCSFHCYVFTGIFYQAASSAAPASRPRLNLQPRSEASAKSADDVWILFIAGYVFIYA